MTHQLAASFDGAAAVEAALAARTADLVDHWSIARRAIETHHPKRLHLEVSEVIDETPTTRTFRLRDPDGELPPFLAGQYVALHVDGTSRPYAISSSPARRDHWDLTVRRVPGGRVSNLLLDSLRIGDEVTTSGPMGTFHHNPLFHGDDGQEWNTWLSAADALDMAGVRQKYGDAEVAVRAMEAGVDLLLMSPAPLAARDAVLEAVRTGRLTEAQLDEKVARVLTMKYRRGIVERPLCDPARVDRIVGIPQHLKAADEVTDRTVTLVSNDGTLPVDVTDRRVLVCGWGATTTTAVADALARLGATTTRQTSNAPTAAQIAAAVTAARSSDLVVVLTNNVATSASQVNLVKALTGSGTPVVTVAVRNPYDVAYYEANAELCTYSYSPVIAGAVARVITGRVNPLGRLPVDVPKPGGGVYLSFGDGLSY